MNAVYNETLLLQPHNPTSGSSLTYIIRLRDGRFVIIDGGFEYDGAELVSKLKELAPKHDTSKPFEIAAWSISHPHIDHITMLHKLIEDDAAFSRIKINKLYINLPTKELTAVRDEKALGELGQISADAEILCKNGTTPEVPQAGMRLDIGELDIDVLYTQDEWQSEPDMTTVNDASTVLKITSKITGRSILILGDIMSKGGNKLLSMYDDATLKSDIVQIAHHALYGPDFELYQKAAPSVCLWTMSHIGYDKYFEAIPRNAQLIGLAKEHYFSCKQETVLVL